MTTPHPTATTFLDALVTRDFDRLAGTLAADATMRGLVPRGHLDCAGRDQVLERFAFWFGGTDDIVALDQGADEVGGRALLSWHFRLRQEWLGKAWHAIAQRAFCDIGPDGRIERIDLLCSGFNPDVSQERAVALDIDALVEVGS
ncbi:MAG: nuclear transport factor 2 family protein [Nostocoides sp.]